MKFDSYWRQYMGPTSLSLALALIVFFSNFAYALPHVTAHTDRDGDGLGDLILYQASKGRFLVRSSASGVIESVAIDGAQAGSVGLVGDFDGDARADLGVFDRTTRQWRINRSSGQALATFVLGDLGDIPVAANFDGAQCSNAATFNRQSAQWTLGDCTGKLVSTVTFGAPGDYPVPADYDCDGRADLAVFDAATQVWQILKTSDSSTLSFRCGLPGDIPVPADRNGDGCAEVAVYRPTSNTYFVASGMVDGAVCGVDDNFPITDVQQWGLWADRPALANVDSDSAVDYTVFRPDTMTYFVIPSTVRESGQLNAQGLPFYFKIPMSKTASGESLGLSDIPRPAAGHHLVRQRVPGDYNGDGRSDMSYVQVDRSAGLTSWQADTGTGSVLSFSLPKAADAFVPGDFDGDGRTEPGIVTVDTTTADLVWRHIQADGSVKSVVFGKNTGAPLVGDFDCDGRDDRVVTYSLGSNSPTSLVPNGVTGFKYWLFDLSSGEDKGTHLFGFAADKAYASDMTGDGCDELVVVRVTNKGLDWFFKRLDEDEVFRVQWGVEGDVPITPADMNGDGLSDYIVVRSVLGGFLVLIRTSGLGDFSESDGFDAFFYGLTGDHPITGHFSGANRNEFAVLRPGRSGQASAFFFRRFLGLGEVRAIRSTYPTVVLPDGSAVANLNTGSGSGDSDSPDGDDTGPAPGCVRTGGDTDFADGAGGGALWKPISEGVSNSASVILLPIGYCGAKITVLGSSGSVVSGIQRTKCGGNGNRAHFWLQKRASEIDEFAPLTVKVEHNGTTECRSVPNPNRRYD